MEIQRTEIYSSPRSIWAQSIRKQGADRLASLLEFPRRSVEFSKSASYCVNYHGRGPLNSGHRVVFPRQGYLFDRLLWLRPKILTAKVGCIEGSMDGTKPYTPLRIIPSNDIRRVMKMAWYVFEPLAEFSNDNH